MHISGSIDQELLLQNDYLVTENRVLKNQTKGQLWLTDWCMPKNHPAPSQACVQDASLATALQLRLTRGNLARARQHPRFAGTKVTRMPA